MFNPTDFNFSLKLTFNKALEYNLESNKFKGLLWAL